MEYEMYYVYVKPDEQGRIVEINSSAFLRHVEGWEKIDGGYGDRFHHAQGNYLSGPLTDERGICCYKLVDGMAVKRTAEEMDADYAAQPAPEPATDELLLEMAADHEYRLCLIELGVTIDDV